MQDEWTLMCLAHNLLKAFTAGLTEAKTLTRLR
jgi:hypothetical protein